jgi:hypothetical protein
MVCHSLTSADCSRQSALAFGTATTIGLLEIGYFLVFGEGFEL